jgi:hypothetical protein
MNNSIALGLAAAARMLYIFKRMKMIHVLGGLASHRIRLRMMTCLQIQSVLREHQAGMQGEYSNRLLLDRTM